MDQTEEDYPKLDWSKGRDWTNVDQTEEDHPSWTGQRIETGQMDWTKEDHTSWTGQRVETGRMWTGQRMWINEEYKRSTLQTGLVNTEAGYQFIVETEGNVCTCTNLYKHHIYKHPAREKTSLNGFILQHTQHIYCYMGIGHMVGLKGPFR